MRREFERKARPRQGERPEYKHLQVRKKTTPIHITWGWLTGDEIERKGEKRMSEKLGDRIDIQDEKEKQYAYHPEAKAEKVAQKATLKKAKRVDGKTFHFIVWEKSASDDWRERLAASMLPFCISPRHDSDIATKDDVMEHEKGLITEGKLIDPHYHVMIQWGNTTTLSNVMDIVKSLLNDEEHHPVNTVFKTLSPSGMYAYLTHSNREKKHQYDENDIVLLNNFSVTELMLNKDSSEMAQKIINDYKHYKWRGYSKAIIHYMNNGEIQEFEYLRCNVAFFTSFFRSERDCGLYDEKKQLDQNSRENTSVINAASDEKKHC